MFLLVSLGVNVLCIRWMLWVVIWAAKTAALTSFFMSADVHRPTLPVSSEMSYFETIISTCSHSRVSLVYCV